jgi:hypothetical protein
VLHWEYDIVMSFRVEDDVDGGVDVVRYDSGAFERVAQVIILSSTSVCSMPPNQDSRLV